ncbi:hypothetical protein HY374_00355 [Candidatus Berkelbacteria bacterium]|nr:hypothetical protein [Candidatus Berkelbacteria bacterium]
MGELDPGEGNSLPKDMGPIPAKEEPIGKMQGKENLSSPEQHPDLELEEILKKVDLAELERAIEEALQTKPMESVVNSLEPYAALAPSDRTRQFLEKHADQLSNLEHIFSKSFTRSAIDSVELLGVLAQILPDFSSQISQALSRQGNEKERLESAVNEVVQNVQRSFDEPTLFIRNYGALVTVFGNERAAELVGQVPESTWRSIYDHLNGTFDASEFDPSDEWDQRAIQRLQQGYQHNDLNRARDIVQVKEHVTIKPATRQAWLKDMKSTLDQGFDPLMAAHQLVDYIRVLRNYRPGPEATV